MSDSVSAPDDGDTAIRARRAEAERLGRVALEQVAEMERERDALLAEVARLRAAVLNQCGDNLCWIGKLNDALPGSGLDVKALPEAEFLESCRRYRAQIVGSLGEFTGGMTIAQLEAKLERFRVVADAVKALARDERWYQDQQQAGLFLRQYLYGITPIADALLAAGMDWREPKEPTR